MHRDAAASYDKSQHNAIKSTLFKSFLKRLSINTYIKHNVIMEDDIIDIAVDRETIQFDLLSTLELLIFNNQEEVKVNKIKSDIDSLDHVSHTPS